MVFSLFDETQSSFNEQICVAGHHVATSNNTILHLKIFFHIVAQRILLLCATKFSLKNEMRGEKRMRKPYNCGACEFQPLKKEGNSNVYLF